MCSSNILQLQREHYMKVFRTASTYSQCHISVFCAFTQAYIRLYQNVERNTYFTAALTYILQNYFGSIVRRCLELSACGIVVVAAPVLFTLFMICCKDTTFLKACHLVFGLFRSLCLDFILSYSACASSLSLRLLWLFVLPYMNINTL